MYLDFYGLKEKPFNATPDPKFLYLTPGHREALAQLTYGVQEHKGFIVLTGEVGTGKTTLIQALLQKLDSNTSVAFVFNSTLSFDDLLEYALQDYGIGKAEASRVQRLVALNNYLIERRRAGQNTVLILDEAQNLEPHTLEQIRLLSNFETPTDKLLQILLVGQPELKDKLQSPQLRQLKQRIGLRCAIPPMTAAETRDYIRTRLRIANGRDLNLFDEAAVRCIAEYAGGEITGASTTLTSSAAGGGSTGGGGASTTGDECRLRACSRSARSRSACPRALKNSLMSSTHQFLREAREVEQ